MEINALNGNVYSFYVGYDTTQISNFADIYKYMIKNTIMYKNLDSLRKCLLHWCWCWCI